ncbi:MAG TPA: metal-dependent hydrolase, partial [Planctomycetota bacterium]|nr:metal-dependent hydrolase [Planctomycetota bacterium]
MGKGRRTSPLMDEYVARQAVFDSKLKVIGYELLFRSGPENFFVGKDGTRASQQVIERALNTFVLGRLSVGARAFVNVTPQLILDGSVSLLPPGQTVLELVGKELQGEALLSACRTLSGQGYWIAVDDFTRSRAAEPMVAKADLLKVDFLQVGPEERRELAAA